MINQPPSSQAELDARRLDYASRQDSAGITAYVDRARTNLHPQFITDTFEHFVAVLIAAGYSTEARS